jgi:hypothetical protein
LVLYSDKTLSEKSELPFTKDGRSGSSFFASDDFMSSSDPDLSGEIF